MSDPVAKTHVPPGLQPAVIRPDKETFLAEENVNRRLESIMVRSFHDVAALAGQHKVNSRIAAYMLAVDRVAAMHRLRGMYA